MSTILKIILCTIFWGIFAYIVLQVPYPNSLTQATLLQLLVFFISLFLAITFTLNIFLSFILLSSILSLGIIFLLILKALDSLNIVTAILTLIAIGLLFSYFRKIKKGSLNPIKSGLTSSGKISKLTGLQGRKRV